MNLTSFDEEKDGTCIVESGEHPLINHKTVVNYPKAQLSKSAVIAETLRRNQILALAAFTPDVFDRIKQGGLDTPFLSDKFKKYLGVNSRFTE